MCAGIVANIQSVDKQLYPLYILCDIYYISIHSVNGYVTYIPWNTVMVVGVQNLFVIIYIITASENYSDVTWASWRLNHLQLDFCIQSGNK